MSHCPLQGPTVSEPLTRAEALRALSLTSDADADDVKRAYRRLAREHHPDLGGDPEVFHELQRAFERLADDDTAPSPPRVSRGRPSRPAPTTTVDPEASDPGRIDWGVVTPVGTRLTRDHLAVALLDPRTPQLRAIAATSRAPGSRLNQLAPHLASNTTSELRIFPADDDRGRPVLTVELRAWSRRGRRALQAAALQGRWARIRGSSSTLLRTNLVPAGDRRATAVRAVARTEELLERLGWGLDAWRLTEV